MRIVFMGTPAFSVPSLESLLRSGHEVAAVYTRADRPRGRGLRLAASPVKRFAAVRGLTVLQPESLRPPEVPERMRLSAPDLIVVVAYGRILPEAMLRIPRYGAVNVHASLLPRHRGAAPIPWAILAGDRETGVTTMQMDPGMDTGPVLLQRRCAIGAAETAGELSARLAALGAELLMETLDGIGRGTLRPLPQDPEGATYAPRLRPENARIDWGEGAGPIDRRVRAMNPAPGAFTRLGGLRLKIWRVRPLPPGPDSTDPGTVLGVSGEGWRVGCGGSGRLEILELQPEGGSRMNPAAFGRGRGLGPGVRFGGG
ncbi:MAG: methionyl-tRNA formyltransferase [Acidobacteria bacterium]|nr:methionyl-tRNA formyltransferase [Acidobacteriota bacterium]